MTGLGPGAALGAVATWYAWGEQQRLKRMERYGIQAIAAIRLSRTDRTGASSELVSLVWRDSSGPRRLDNFEVSGRLATALRRAGQSQQPMRITFLPGAIRTHPVPTDDLPELQADALRATQVLATATLLCCALMWWMHVPRRIRRHARLQRARATVDTATPTDPAGERPARHTPDMAREP